MTFSKNTLVNSAVALILGLIACGVIFYEFNVIPPMMNKDEQEFAILAMSLEGQPYAPYSPLATGHATLYFYVILASFKLVGYNEFGLRLPAAIFGVINTILFYFVLKRILPENKNGWIAAIFGAFTLITLRWYINFARFAFEATFLLFFELISTLFIFLYKKKSNIWYLIGSGVFAGLAYNSYTPGRIFFILPLFLLALDVNLKKINWKEFKPMAIFLASFGVMILPITLYLSQNTDTRIYQQFFITNEQLSIPTRLLFLGQNILNNFTMFFLKGDVNGIHNYPYKAALNPIIGVFFIAGLVLSIRNIKKDANKYFLLYFLISVAPTWFTYPWENPNMLRTFTVLPAIAYFVATSVWWLTEKIKYVIPLIAILIVLFIASAVYEIRTYFVFQSDVFKDVYTHSIRFEDYIYQPDPEL